MAQRLWLVKQLRLAKTAQAVIQLLLRHHFNSYHFLQTDLKSACEVTAKAGKYQIKWVKRLWMGSASLKKLVEKRMA